VDRLPRERFGLGLTGQVLEVGPGTTAFPTAPGAESRFADRPIPGGRDANFPELVGQPHGPDADYEVDIDVDGLAGIVDQSFDAVVLSHVVEHMADPIHGLQECLRVLRPSGRLVLILPLRHTTFDSLRPGTPLAHLVAEHRAGVTQVDDEHIRQFCHSVYNQTPSWPTEERERHNPERLDADLLALHRRRSIHAHCWDAEEMAAGLVGMIAAGELGVALVDLFFSDDPGAADIEFGFVLQPAPPGAVTAAAFIDAWVGAVLSDETRDPTKVATFTEALARDLPGVVEPEADARALVARPMHTAAQLLRDAQARGHALTKERDAARARADDVDAQLTARDTELSDVRGSRTYRAGEVVTAPVRLVRRLTR
jgi:SAM-dependent methyltransferase